MQIRSISGISDPSKARLVYYNGVELVHGPADSAGYQPSDATLTALAAFNTNGFLVQTAADTFAGRTLAAPAAGLTIANPAGTAGNPTFALANDLAALEGLGSTGIAVRTAADTWAQRSLTSSSNHLTITNPAGIGGNPVLDLAVGQIVAGSYTPTITNGANVGASTPLESHYVRIGNRCIVYLGFNVDPTAAANTLTVVEISLPVASNFAIATDLWGCACTNANAQRGGNFLASVANDRAVFQFQAETVDNTGFLGSFGYKIL